MNIVVIKGYPESVASLIQALIGLGNTIYLVTKTKNNSDYLVIYGV
jgi:hypothetical protein